MADNSENESRIEILPIHGMWGDHRWWENFAGFCKGTNLSVNAYDLPEHGKRFTNLKSLRSSSLEDYVNDLLCEIKKFPQAPILIGHSLGCLLVEAVLDRLPTPPPAIILLAPTRHEVFRNSVISFAAKHPLLFTKLNLTRSMWPPVSTPALAREMLFPLDMPDVELKKYHQRMQDESHSVALQLLFGRGPKASRAPKECSVFVLGGKRDHAVKMKDVEQVAQFHGVQVDWFDLPHNLLLSPGWEQVAERIKAYIQRVARS